MTALLGVRDEEGGWVARLRRRVDALWIERRLEMFTLTYNCGISSDTTRDVIRRLQPTIDALSTEDHEFAFIVSLGTNDASRSRSTGEHTVPIDEYKANLSQIVAVASQYANKVMLLGSLPIDDAKAQLYQGLADVQSSNADICAYEQAMGSVADGLGVQFTPLFRLVDVSEVSEFLFHDGDHPNGKGHQLIADAVWPTVAEWINC